MFKMHGISPLARASALELLGSIFSQEFGRYLQVSSVSSTENSAVVGSLFLVTNAEWCRRRKFGMHSHKVISREKRRRGKATRQEFAFVLIAQKFVMLTCITHATSCHSLLTLPCCKKCPNALR
jgi:hypothetical protein